MRRKIDRAEAPEEPKKDLPKLVLPHDSANEAAIVAASFLFEDVRSQVIGRLVPDHFQQREHRELWQAFQEAKRRQLQLDLALVEQMAGGECARYLAELSELRPDPPKNLNFHVQTVLWDYARSGVARGALPAFVEALRDPKAEPEKVRGFARAVLQSLEGHEDRKYLLEPRALVRDQMKEIERRASGIATFDFGLPGLDWYDDGTRRMVPGSAPGQVTVVTGVSGSGKTTSTASIVLGIAFPGWQQNDFEKKGRRVLYGAWEMKGGMTLELMACISLGWSRSAIVEGRGAIATPDGRLAILERMELLATRIIFLGNPFRRKAGEKRSNERNLDIVQGYIADAGCEVFVADLWKRCLVRTDPEEEEEALIRQQMMAEEMNVHAILLQQQRLKDIEMRPDKRPTREGIKGSGAWVEVADTIIGVHRPALFKNVDDDTIELIVLKQRYGKWPLVVEFRWNPTIGSIRGGRHVDYERPGEGNDIDAGRSLASHYRR
jgi:replicative DNA helicase